MHHRSSQDNPNQLNLLTAASGARRPQRPLTAIDFGAQSAQDPLQTAACTGTSALFLRGAHLSSARSSSGRVAGAATSSLFYTLNIRETCLVLLFASRRSFPVG